MDAHDWDERYRSRERLFSGNPNGVLVAEVADLPPGRALDLGCGEGADAIWLARRGWRVTGIDLSAVALERAAAAGADLADRLTWTRGDLAATAPEQGAFDLVSAQYLPLPKAPGDAALRGLLGAVAPGGTLLFAGHALNGLGHLRGEGVDPTAFYQPAEIARALDRDWFVEVDETRLRSAPAPAGTHHTHDTVLRARRLD
ncbi:methyltransferase domain-containing protein [Glycomyces sp. A-F 0318]|uniref:class I SAM-dependent methyltransferase n=1 Tax=Glycomyces amatae TaxID=2881355 RepID=UPI001E327A8B|nr:class I SAM-dependent methyltransferase [Glycomyces amatae]MCD0447444.1 methyltransferase domain-containing protein [Glycomyces amatae]